MSFKFFKNGKEITPPKRVTWYFEIKPDARFESIPEKVETNANFWRRKLGLPMDSKIVFVPNDNYIMELPTAEITKEDECDAPTQPTIDNSSDDTVHDGSAPESDLPQDAADSDDTPKPKRKSKAADVPPMPEQLADGDSPVSE